MAEDNGEHKSVYFLESDYYTRMRTNDVSMVLQFVCIEVMQYFSADTLIREAMAAAMAAAEQ